MTKPVAETSEATVKRRYPNSFLLRNFKGWCIYEGEPNPNNRLTGYHADFDDAWAELARTVAEPAVPAPAPDSSLTDEELDTIDNEIMDGPR